MIHLTLIPLTVDIISNIVLEIWKYLIMLLTLFKFGNYLDNLNKFAIFLYN